MLFVIKRNIYLLYAIGLLQGMVFYAPVATLYREAQGVSIFEIALLESVSLVLCLVLEIPWGIAADRIGYKKTMVFCCGLYFVSKLVFWAAEGFWWFMLERIMLSIVMAGLSGVDVSMLYLSCGEGRSRRAFAVYNSLATVGMLSATLLFSVCIGENYKLAAAMTALSYGMAFVLSLFLREVKSEAQRSFRFREFKRLLADVLKNRRLIMFLASVALFSETYHTVTVFLNQPKYESCGMSASAIGLVYALVTLSGTLAVMSEPLVKRLGEKRGVLLLAAAAAAACILLAFTGSAGLSVLGVLVLNVAMCVFEPIQLEMQNREVRTANRATELSIFAIIIDSIGAGASLAFGALAERSLALGFGFGAAACIAGCALLIAALPKNTNIEEKSNAS